MENNNLVDETTEAVTEDSAPSDLNDSSTDDGSAVTTEDSATSETDETSAESAGGKPKGKEGASERIKQLVRQREEEREARQKAENEAAYLKGQLEAKKEPEKPATAREDVAPMPDDFASYDDYVDARAAWVAERKYKALRESEKQEDERKVTETKQAEAQRTFTEKVAAAKEKHLDFESVAFNKTLPVTQVMADALKDSDIGTDILYHLGKNPQEAARIAALPPIAAIREIGKLELKLTIPASTNAAAKTISNAPAPPSTVDGNSGGAKKDPDKMSDAEWAAWYKAEQIKKLTANKK